MSDVCQFCGAGLESSTEDEQYKIDHYSCDTTINIGPFDTGTTQSKDCRITELERLLAEMTKERDLAVADNAALIDWINHHGLDGRMWAIMQMHYELDPDSEPTEEELKETEDKQSEWFRSRMKILNADHPGTSLLEERYAFDRIHDWLKCPKSTDEDGYLSPSTEAVVSALLLFRKLRDSGTQYERMVENGDGGISFESSSVTYEIDGRGRVERLIFENSKLIEREPFIV